MERDTSPVLEISDLSAGYGRARIIENCAVSVGGGEVVCVIGPNGAGKSTLLKAILGLNRTFGGSVKIRGTELSKKPTHVRVQHGLGYVPQGHQMFSNLTVLENLRMGGFHMTDYDDRDARIDELMEMFPRVRERSNIRAGLLSGGEQQMVAMCRALMTRPAILLLDEPTVGLAPILVEHVMEQVLELRKLGVTMLMVEQNAVMALQTSDRAYIVDGGTTSESHDAATLLASDEVRKRYLGL
ncbi:MAG: ABC transporter ATP-binding protein [Acidimicrobiia bacterium]|nr:ABC transporter ATP-binding protein [Acidimicrobiia bacterium]